MRRVVLTLVVALGLSLTPVVSGSSTPVAAAAPSDIVAIVIEGTGYGHGRGMSQWGAYGWAVDQGKSWQWILDHYYGGTALTTVNTAQQRIQVRLLGFDGTSTLGVTSGTGTVSAGGVSSRSIFAKEVSPNSFEIWGSTAVACKSSTALVVPNGDIAQNSTNATAVRQIQTFLNAFRIAGDSQLGVDGQFGALTAARLRDWESDQGLTIDGIWKNADATRARQLIAAQASSAVFTKLTTVAGPITFTTAKGENSSAAPSSVLGVCDGSGKVTHYRGAIEFHNATGNTNWVVNDVKTEDYLRGVVPKEISASWAAAPGGANAVKAQAVAARSYGLQQNRYAPYASICDTQSCQVYFGSATRVNATAAATNIEDTRTDAAIKATAGMVRTKNGAVVATEFSASNGPRTAGGTFPAVNDAPGDGTAKNPKHKWTRVLDADTVAAKYGLGTITSAAMVEALSSVNRQYDGNWYNDVLINGSKRVEAWAFRSDFGLPSPGFTVRVITRDTTGKSFAMIGDSVGNSIAGSITSEFVTLTDGMFASSRINVRDSRCTAHRCVNGDPLSNGAEIAAGLPMNLDLVVVELGYNQESSAGFAADIDTMMRALQSRNVGRVAWVNLATAPGIAPYAATYASRNAALRAATARWGNLTILDWDAASKTPERSRWFVDHAHLTDSSSTKGDAGQAQFALWLRQQVATLAPTNPFSTKVTPNQPLRFRVAGVGGVPAGASAVALNVTAVDPAGWGFLTVWPCGSKMPNASNVNFVAAGAVEPNSVLAKVDATGEVCVYTSSTTHVLVDVAGWFSGGFESLVPKRIVDTRNGIGAATAKVVPQTPLRVKVAGVGGVPAGASAVALNVTAVDPAGWGFLTVWPCGSKMPNASNVNFVAAGAVEPNSVLAKVDATGEVCVYTSSTTHVLVDVAGWFSGGFESLVPKRIVDTRNGIGAATAKVVPQTPLRVKVAGVGGVPAGASAVALNVTAVDPAGWGFLTVWPCGSKMPNASNVNFVAAGAVEPNSVLAKVDATGEVCVYTSSTTHVLVDVAGWFSGGFESLVPKRIVDTRNGIGTP